MLIGVVQPSFHLVEAQAKETLPSIAFIDRTLNLPAQRLSTFRLRPFVCCSRARIRRRIHSQFSACSGKSTRWPKAAASIRRSVPVCARRPAPSAPTHQHCPAADRLVCRGISAMSPITRRFLRPTDAENRQRPAIQPAPEAREWATV